MADPVQDWASMASAIGTVAAVVVALWLQVWRVWRRRPILSMEFDAASDDVIPVQLDEWYECWLRVRVRNKPGRDPARNASVTLLGIRRRSADGDWLPLRPNPIPLRTLKWSDVMANAVEIPAGLWHRVDIGYVTYYPDSTHSPTIGMVPWPTNDDWQGPTLRTRSRNLLPHGDHDYRLFCALACDNGPTSYHEVDLRTRRDGDPERMLSIIGTRRISGRQLGAELVRDRGGPR